MKFWHSCCLLIWLQVLSLVLCSSAGAEAQEEQQLLKELIANSENISTLYACFEQTKQLTALNIPLRSQGILCFSGDQGHLKSLLWEYTSPIVQGFYLKSGQNLIWNQNRNQQASPRGHEGAMLQAMGEQVVKFIRLDALSLEKNYAIKIDSHKLELQLIPKQTGLFAAIQLFFQPDKKKLQQLVLTEQHGDRTELNFTQIRLNEPLPDVCQP